MYKHVGKIINTDMRCVVVFMQIPGREDHALVVNMDSIPPHFERPLRAIVESTEGQSVTALYEILSRRLMPDTGVKVLDALHNARLLQPVHIDQIIMTPRPSMAFPLRQVIAAMAGEAAKLPPQTDFSAEKFNPHLHNQKLRSQEDRINLAKNILMEAEELSRTAAQKVAKAYEMAPELRPAVAHPTMAQTSQSWAPPPRLPVINENLDVEDILVDDFVPVIPTNDILVETETADAQTIEHYADMMMGKVPQPTPVPAPAPAAKKPRAKKTV